MNHMFRSMTNADLCKGHPGSGSSLCRVTPVARAAFVSILTCLALFIVSSSCHAAQRKVVDRVVAVVNDDIIRLSDLEARLAPVVAGIHSRGLLPADEKNAVYAARVKMLDEMIDELLADQQIKKAGIRISDREVDDIIERIKRINSMTDEDLRRELAKQGMDLDEYRKEIKNQLKRSKLVSRMLDSKIVITNEEIERYYNAHGDIYGGKREYILRNIIIPFDKGDEKAKDAAYKAMQKIKSLLDQGMDFSEAAKKFSQGMNAAQGGYLGRFAIDDLAADIKKVIASLGEDQYSDVVETDQGFQIFYVDKIEETGPVPLEKVRDEIRNKLYDEAVNEAFSKWIQRLRAEAHIKIIM